MQHNAHHPRPSSSSRPASPFRPSYDLSLYIVSIPSHIAGAIPWHNSGAPAFAATAASWVVKRTTAGLRCSSQLLMLPNWPSTRRTCASSAPSHRPNRQITPSNSVGRSGISLSWRTVVPTTEAYTSAITCKRALQGLMLHVGGWGITQTLNQSPHTLRASLNMVFSSGVLGTVPSSECW